MDTITFSEQGFGTVDPTYVFDDNTVTFDGVILGDSAQPASPVIAANFSYLGPVFINFDIPVDFVSLDVGFFDNLGSTRIEFRNAAGELLFSTNNDDLGVLTFSFASEEGIASVAAIDESFDASGFSVDTVVFGENVEQLPPPAVSLLDSAPATIDRNFGTVDEGATFFYQGSVGGTDTEDALRINVAEDMVATFNVFLASNSGNVSTFTVNLTEGVNFVNVAPLEAYENAEDYVVTFSVVDAETTPREEIIDDLLEELLGGVFNLAEVSADLATYFRTNAGNIDELTGFLDDFGKKLGLIGLALDIAGRIDNVIAAEEPDQQAFVETIDMLTGIAITGVVSAGATYVGTPLAGILGGVVSGVVYTNFISDGVRDEAGDFYDDLVGNPSQQLNLNTLLSAQIDLTDFTFDAEFYLATYPDAAEAVESGEAISAIVHYLTTGIGLGYEINAGGAVVDPGDLAGDFEIANAANLYNFGVFTAAAGDLAGDAVSTGESALADFINEQRTEGTEFAFNAALSALANRVAIDLVVNQNGAPLGGAISENAAGWITELSNGEIWNDALADLATESGIFLGQASILGAFNPGTSIEEVYEYINNSLAGTALLVGLDNNSVGIAEFGGIWVVIVTPQILDDDTVIDDTDVLRLFGDAMADFLLGTGISDLIEGLSNADQLSGLGGDDDISGNGGNDTLDGGEGDDMLSGGFGFDDVTGGAGNDTIDGQNGADTLNGGDDDDQVSGGAGNDSVDGGAGDDVISGGIGFDTINGGQDDDVLTGLAGFDALNGGGGDDVLNGNDGFDLLSGGVGNDTLNGGIGTDTLNGNAGNDLLVGGAGSDVLNGGADNDTLNGNAGADLLEGGAGDDRLNGGINQDTLRGGEGNDTVLGGNGADMLDGGGGNDRVEGNAGSDTLTGGAGQDTLKGGIGADTFVFSAGDDNDSITDFQVGVDAVELDLDLFGGTAPTAAALSALASTSADGFLVLTFGGGDSLTFNGVTSLAQIDDDLTFV
ncbi:calcium-binding protein [uncultured Tateyamaria sp.]|uniref:calcium-binding protein n=1 Tax=uncultured Tateyamaria sp. TaxID=455651 RepID=UPI00262B755A|nr:calcium-binding protein [uncultured Tateyamaria sp.]